MLMTQKKATEYGHILMLSSWGFAIVLSSFFFLYLGYQLDKAFNTSPSFMFGLFFLGIMLGVGKLYREAWTIKDNKKR